jgi:hypothetical protein
MALLVLVLKWLQWKYMVTDNASDIYFGLIAEMYKNPLFAVLISYAEVLPIGLVVAFVSALILKRKSGPTAL